MSAKPAPPPVAETPNFGASAATGATGLAAAEIVCSAEAGPEGGRWSWHHLKRSAQTETALHQDPSLPEEVTSALLERDTLPRVITIEGHTVVYLRGINHLPKARPEEMISLRLAITADRVISVEIKRLRIVDRLIRQMREGSGPETPGALVAALIEVIRRETEPVLDALEDDLARLEHKSVQRTDPMGVLDRQALIAARKQAIGLHRYISPQGHAVEDLARLKAGWIRQTRRLKAEASAFQRITADIEALRLRAQLVAEETAMAASERINRTILLLSVVSVIFLPITALTGLLGVNLDGIPFAHTPWAFRAFCALLLAVAGFAAWLAVRLLR